MEEVVKKPDIDEETTGKPEKSEAGDTEDKLKELQTHENELTEDDSLKSKSFNGKLPHEVLESILHDGDAGAAEDGLGVAHGHSPFDPTQEHVYEGSVNHETKSEEKYSNAVSIAEGPESGDKEFLQSENKEADEPLKSAPKQDEKGIEPAGTAAEKNDTEGKDTVTEIRILPEKSEIEHENDHSVVSLDEDSRWHSLLGEPINTSELQKEIEGLHSELEKEIIPHEVLKRVRDETLAHVGEMRDELESELIPNHVTNFKENSQGHVVLMGKMSLSEIETEERLIEEKRIEKLRAQAMRFQHQAEDVATREKLAKMRILQGTQESKDRLHLREAHLIRRQRQKLREQQIAFRHAESRLKQVFKAKSATLESEYGDLRASDDLYSAAQARHFRLYLDLAPRLVSVRIQMLRAIKNKLPTGRYVMMATLHDRLGGTALRWSKLHDAQWSGSTRQPVRHESKFYNTEISFGQDYNMINLACPAKAFTRPGMVLIFELFLCRGRHSLTNKVVGWGAFPMCNAQLDVVQGKFKVPLLRGEVDKAVVKYQQIERRINDSLDTWLCNMYFEAKPLDKHIVENKDYKINMKFTNQLMRLRQMEDEDGYISEEEQIDINEEGEDTSKLERVDSLEKNMTTEDPLIAMFNKLDQTFVSAERIDMGEEDSAEKRRENELFLEKVHPSIRAKQLEKYKFHLRQEFETPTDELSERLIYIKSELVADLNLTKWRTLEFWSMIAMIALVFWVRLYTHYAAQWALLNIIRVPIVEFVPKLHTVELIYPTDNITLATEVFVIIIGVGFNLTIFAALIGMAFAAQVLLETFPDTGSRFLFAFGLATMFDPILIVIVDSAIGNWNGDAFKLYNYFVAREGAGLPGIFLTCFINILLVVFAAFLLYNYLLHVHMNGRMMDVFHRLHGDEAMFFVPEDLEISIRNLRWILSKAATWRGFHGSSRKVSATAFITRDHLDPSYEERAIHLAIYTQSLKGDRELYRHFLRREDGTIVELFDTSEIFGSEDYGKVQDSLNKMKEDESEGQDLVKEIAHDFDPQKPSKPSESFGIQMKSLKGELEPLLE